MPSENTKRIARNTAMLYVRMLLLMGVTFYTSRIVLNALGVEDYGIYNVVGGVVIFLSFLNNTLAMSTQRFLNYEMGNAGGGNLEKVFSYALTGHYIVAGVFLFLAETIGLWFVYNQLIIPENRFTAMLWVYHFSVLTFIVNIISTPYNAAIIATEKMDAYAYVSIFEAILKLGISYLLFVLPFDKLKLYAVLLFFVALLVRFAYFAYCRQKIEWITSKLRWNEVYMKKIFSFSGWIFMGGFSHVLSVQGVNVLINMFFNPVHNAARGIAVQLQAGVNTFSANFMTAVRPQIVKSYAGGDYHYAFSLAFMSAKISYFLMLLIIVPLLLNTDYILSLWLKIVPEHAVVFTRLSLLDILLGAMISPLAALSQASGKVKWYQLIISSGFLLVFLLTYLFYRLGFASYTTFVVSIAITALGTLGRILELRHTVGFPIRRFFVEVVSRVTGVSVGVVVFAMICWNFMRVGSLGNLFLTSLLSLLFTGLLIWFLGMKSNEKEYILSKIHLKL